MEEIRRIVRETRKELKLYKALGKPIFSGRKPYRGSLIPLPACPHPCTSWTARALLWSPLIG